MLSSIDVVAQKQIITLWWEAAVLEKSNQIFILSVNISAHFQRSLEFDQHGLFMKDLFYFCAEGYHILFL